MRGCPIFAPFAKVGPSSFSVGLFPSSMPKNLKRYYGRSDLHFLTFSCYRRLPALGTAKTRNEFLRALDEVRRKYGFALVGYVVMPEHVHLLMSEPKIGTPSTIVHSLKLRVSKRLRAKSEGSMGAPSYSGRGTPLLEIEFIN